MILEYNGKFYEIFQRIPENDPVYRLVIFSEKINAEEVPPAEPDVVLWDNDGKYILFDGLNYYQLTKEEIISDVGFKGIWFDAVERFYGGKKVGFEPDEPEDYFLEVLSDYMVDLGDEVEEFGMVKVLCMPGKSVCRPGKATLFVTKGKEHCLFGIHGYIYKTGRMVGDKFIKDLIGFDMNFWKA